MKAVATYAPFGVRPHYFRTDGLTHGSTIREMIAMQSKPGWDHMGVRQYLARSPDGLHTPFADIHAVPPGHELIETDAGVALRQCEPSKRSQRPLPELLEQAVAGLVADGRRAAVALSGGLDSALLVAVLRKLGRDDIPVFTVASGLSGYCERQVTARAAQLLGVENLQVIEITGDDMVAAFPDVITHAEVPLFNLHPAHRWLLAKALQREGYEVLLTGDGADQVFAGSDPRNYLPIIGALTRAAGLELRSPFFDDELIEGAPEPTPTKIALREAARTWLPEELITRPKTATYAPTLDVSVFWNERAIRDLAQQLDLPQPKRGTDAETTLWTSLGILADFLT